MVSRVWFLSVFFAVAFGAVVGRAQPRMECAEGTAWDGIACAHPRATCGAWDGLSCDPKPASPAVERSAEAEFARVDAVARTVCPEEDEARQVYSGTVVDVLKAVDTALGQTEALNRRLEDLREARQTPRWTVATLARSGRLYDCIWNSIRRADPVLFTPQQLTLLNKLQAISTGLNQGAWGASRLGQMQQQIDDTKEQLRQKWLELREKYVQAIEEKMVARYVIAALLARHYALEGFIFTRAYERLPIVAAVIGPSGMSSILRTTPDPTDPTLDPQQRRHVQYTDGAFGVRP
jgi:hypothetical protein